MRHLLVTGAFLFLAGCGSNSSNTTSAACAGPYTGTWAGILPTGTTLTLGEDCSYLYAGTDSCQSTGTYSAPLGASGTVTVSITSATVGACLAAGSYTCQYLIDSGGTPLGLAINCGPGTQGFAKN